MQIDVNAAADRATLMRAQLTSSRSVPLDPKTIISTGGRTMTGSVTVRSISKPGAPTDLVSRPGKNISSIRPDPSVNKGPM